MKKMVLMLLMLVGLLGCSINTPVKQIKAELQNAPYVKLYYADKIIYGQVIATKKYALILHPVDNLRGNLTVNTKVKMFFDYHQIKTFEVIPTLDELKRR